MKKLAFLLAAGALIAVQARADEKVEEHHEVKTNKHGVVTKQHHEKKSKHSRTKVDSDSHAKLGGGTVSTTDTVQDGDHMKKHEVKEKTERDANGDVVKHEVEKK